MRYFVIFSLFLNSCSEYVSKPCTTQEVSLNIKTFCDKNQNNYENYESCTQERENIYHSCGEHKVTASATINGIAWIPVLVILLPLFLISLPFYIIKESNKKK